MKARHNIKLSDRRSIMAESSLPQPCRLCLVYFADTVDVHDFSDKEKYLTEMINRLFSLEIKHNDTYSTALCVECIKHIEDIHIYYLKVKMAQSKLSEMIIPIKKFKHAKKTLPMKTEALQDPLSTCDEILIENSDFDVKQERAQLGLNREVKLEFENTADDADDGSVDMEDISDDSPSALATISESQCDSPSITNKRVDGSYDGSTLIIPPMEMYRDGRLCLKGAKLQNAVTNFYNMTCHVCNDNNDFNTIPELFSHFETMHQTKGYLVCCNKRLYKRRTIYAHMAQHVQPSAFECPICKKMLSLPDNLIVHLQKHLPESERPHKCDQCERRYSCASGLVAHKLTHVPVEERLLYDCKICGKVFTIYASFTSHMNVVHSMTKFLCAECGRSFKSKACLKDHMMVHDTVEENKEKCPQCGFMCKNKRSLKMHLRRHTADRLFCTKCDYNTDLRARLNVHMKVKHSDSKPFSCTECHMKFKLYNGLQTHMAQHTGERKYSCEFCPKTFASSGNYYTHRKRMHPGLYSKKIRKITETSKTSMVDEQESAASETEVGELAREQIKIFEANHKKIIKKTVDASDQ